MCVFPRLSPFLCVSLRAIIALYFSIHVLILSAKVKYLKGDLEHDKKDYGKALSYYTEGIEVNCKDDEINAKLYASRSHSHNHLGELTRLFFFLIYLFK